MVNVQKKDSTRVFYVYIVCYYNNNTMIHEYVNNTVHKQPMNNDRYKKVPCWFVLDMYNGNTMPFGHDKTNLYNFELCAKVLPKIPWY